MWDQLESGFRSVLQSALEARRDFDGLSAAMTQIFMTSEDLFERLQQEPRLAPDFAHVKCKQGCAHCCYYKVAASPAEILVIAGFIRRSLEGDTLDAVREGVTEARQKTDGLPALDRLKSKTACPLLVDNSCSIYVLRPAQCRSSNSTSVSRCRTALERGKDMEIKGVAAQRSFFKDMLTRLIKVQEDLNLPSGRIELIAGLDIALESDDVTDRWLAGEDVFAPARIAELEGAA